MVAGDINKADLYRPVIGCDGVERGETKVDRNAPLLLFGRPISIHACERAYQRSLAVVDMAGSAHDNGSNSTQAYWIILPLRPAAGFVAAISGRSGLSPLARCSCNRDIDASQFPMKSDSTVRRSNRALPSLTRAMTGGRKLSQREQERCERRRFMPQRQSCTRQGRSRRSPAADKLSTGTTSTVKAADGNSSTI